MTTSTQDNFAFRLLFAGKDAVLWDELELLVTQMQGARIEVSRSGSCEDVLARLQKENFDLCLAAEPLAGGTVPQLIRSVSAGTCKVPIIQVATGDRKESVSEAMEAGAADFLTRQEMTLPILERSFRYVIERRNMEEEMGMLLAAAGEAANAKAQFMSNITHEFKTPLNAVIGMIDLVLESDLSHKQHENLMLARFSAESLLRLMGNIIDFSSLERGKISPDNKFFSVRNFLAKVLLPLHVAAERKALRFTTHIGPSVPDMLYGDPERLSQVIGHLLNNAVKFTEEGEISLSVEVKESDESGTTLHWMVRDTGVGIPKERIDRMFQGFTQMDGSSTRRHGGVGLGLSIVRNLVALLGGKTWVESEPRRGTTFHFTTRSTVAPGRETAPRHEGLPASGGVLPQEKTARILAVEDSLVNQMVLTEFLEKAGYEVTIVDNGRKAVDEVARNPYAVVLMDLQMPVMDGYEATALIREREEKEGRRRIPIIALTGSEYCQDRERCGRVGMDGYLTKPLKQKELVKLIGDHLSQRDQPSPAVVSAIPEFLVRYLDVQEVLSTLGGDVGLLFQLVEYFLQEGPEQLRNIRQGIEQKAEGVVEQSAHKLKGMAANIGATSIADDAFRIQLAVRRSDLVSPLPLLANLEMIMSEMDHNLKEMHLMPKRRAE